MRFSISNFRKYIPLISFCAVFLTLFTVWEITIRIHYNPPVSTPNKDFFNDGINLSESNSREHLLIFGNCLMLNSLSPQIILEELNKYEPEKEKVKIVNLALHELAPQSYLIYLEKLNYYPRAVIFNVNSWINSDNFDMDANTLLQNDLFGSTDNEKNKIKLLKAEGGGTSDNLQSKIQYKIENQLYDNIKSLEKRYHLFDVTFFIFNYFTTLDLKRSLYNLQLQSWFKLKSQQIDGYGYQGFEVDYGKEWDTGADMMADKLLSRMSLGSFLNDNYWQRLEDLIIKFEKEGTIMYIVRSPLHPKIYSYENKKYNVNNRLLRLSSKTGVHLIDLNQDEIIKKVKLFDAAHPDHKSAINISRFISKKIATITPEVVFLPESQKNE